MTQICPRVQGTGVSEREASCQDWVPYQISAITEVATKLQFAKTRINQTT